MRLALAVPLAALLLVAALGAAAEDAAPPAMGSAALVEEAAAWDRKTVRFLGEAIGEAMRRGDHAWIHLNDDAYGLAGPGEDAGRAGTNGGIGIWVVAEQTAAIVRFGDYRFHGDLVEVTGTFNAACSQHGGDLDIHAASLRVVRAGYATPHPVPASRAIAAAILAAGVLALLVVRAAGRRSRRPGDRRTPPA